MYQEWAVVGGGCRHALIVRLQSILVYQLRAPRVCVCVCVCVCSRACVEEGDREGGGGREEREIIEKDAEIIWRQSSISGSRSVPVTCIARHLRRAFSGVVLSVYPAGARSEAGQLPRGSGRTCTGPASSVTTPMSTEDLWIISNDSDEAPPHLPPKLSKHPKEELLREGGWQRLAARRVESIECPHRPRPLALVSPMTTGVVEHPHPTPHTYSPHPSAPDKEGVGWTMPYYARGSFSLPPSLPPSPPPSLPPSLPLFETEKR